ncbi:hypothetical protein PanWU01x14_200280, partial [Parasponia andersonii]
FNAKSHRNDEIPSLCPIPIPTSLFLPPFPLTVSHSQFCPKPQSLKCRFSTSQPSLRCQSLKMLNGHYKTTKVPKRKRLPGLQGRKVEISRCEGG